MAAIATETISSARTSRRRQLGYALRQPAISVGAVIMVFFLFVALFAPLLSPNDPLAQNVLEGLKPPSAEHPLGTDKLGREVLSRLLYGARISLFVGVAVVLIASF